MAIGFQRNAGTDPPTREAGPNASELGLYDPLGNTLMTKKQVSGSAHGVYG